MPAAPALDHVALWVAERDELAGALLSLLGVHVIERTDDFTLIGADARQGKLTLFDAPGPRERGALEHIGMRCRDPRRAVESLPPGTVLSRGEQGEAVVTMPAGIAVALVPCGEDALDGDLDHVVLRVADPEAARAGFARLGFAEADGSLDAGGRRLRFVGGGAAHAVRPVLNHLALLVDDADAHIAAAQEAGAELAEIKDAANTYAGFVWGPERIKLEYVQHKPEFALT